MLCGILFPRLLFGAKRMTEKLTRTNQSADKILNVVETMARDGVPMRLSDIAQKSGLPQSTAFRMVNALRERGYVDQDRNTEKYYLTLKFSAIGDMIRAKFDLRDLAHPYMEHIAAECRNFCYLAVERDQEVVYIDMATPPGAVLARMPFIGKRVPLHCAGVGIIILSERSGHEVDEYLQKLEPNIANDPDYIRGKIEETRRNGYSALADRIEIDRGSVAMGLRNHSGQIVAALSVGGSVTDFTPDYVEMVRRYLQKAVDAISEKLGFNFL